MSRVASIIVEVVGLSPVVELSFFKEEFSFIFLPESCSLPHAKIFHTQPRLLRGNRVTQPYFIPLFGVKPIPTLNNMSPKTLAPKCSPELDMING